VVERGEGVAWRAARACFSCCVLCLACALDERNFATLGGIDGGAGAGGFVPDPRATDPGSPSAPRLALDATPVQLGPVAIGFPSRARLAVSNVGDAALPPPDVSWSETSDADFSVVQNQCLAAVAPGQSCELRVQLVPTKAGPIAATLRVAGAASGSVDVPFAGLGLVASDVSIAPASGSFEDFGEVLVGAMAVGQFSVTNPGVEPTGALRFNVNQPAFALLPAAADAAAAPPACPVGESLAAGASCAVRIGFTPSARGPVEATLTAIIGETSGVSTTLSGAGMVTGVLATSTTTLDFEGVLPGETARRTLTIENAGDEPLTLGGFALEPTEGTDFSIVGGTCAAGQVLAAGASCDLELEFRPVTSEATSTAEVVIGAAGDQTQRIALTGRALKRGQLEITVPTPGDEEFGDVLLGEGLVHTFQVANPGAQPSGALTLQGTNGFEIAPSAAAGDCTPETSLIDGQTCAIHVRFAPTERGAVEGALTVSSELAGASSLALGGNGLAPAALTLAVSEINFGRVTTGTTARGAFGLSNAGDQGLPSPSFELKGAQAAAFTFESGCSAELGFEETCEVALTFAPSAASSSSATLEIAAEPGGRASVLLLGQGILPGSLELAPVAEDGTDFGDVALGGWVMRSFTLTNPGGEPSGPLTLRTDNAAFAVSPRECGALEPGGLVDDASCTFDVTFTPTHATAAVARLLATSAALGEVSLELRGRGRAPARLDAVTLHDFGMLPVGVAPGADNQLTWVLNNTGDLPTGELAVVSDHPDEFVITEGEDSCSGAQIPARDSCQLGITFWPRDTGQISGAINVTDTGSGATLTLALTGFGQRLVGLGEACGEDAACEATLSCTRCLDGIERCAPVGGCCPTDQDCGDGVCISADRTDASCCEASPECSPCQACDPSGRACEPLERGSSDPGCVSAAGATLLCSGQGSCFEPECTSDAECNDLCKRCQSYQCENVALRGDTCFSGSIISGYCTGDSTGCVRCLEDAHCAPLLCDTNDGTCFCNDDSQCAPGTCSNGACL